MVSARGGDAAWLSPWIRAHGEAQLRVPPGHEWKMLEVAWALGCFRNAGQGSFQAKVLTWNSFKRRGFASQQTMAPWPGFLCIFRVIFHSDNESDGSGIFH